MDIGDLPHDDIRRAAWLNIDRYTTVWVNAWPSQDMWSSDEEFFEITCRYFGLPSPACATLVGASIGGTRNRLDAYGFKLCAAALPGDGFRDQHDTLKWQLLEDLREMRVRATPEVYGLFAPLLPQVARDHYDQLPSRKRQGLVPDMLVQCRDNPEAANRAILVEIKTLHYAKHVPGGD